MLVASLDPQFEIYDEGEDYLSVCSNLSEEQIVTFANEERPGDRPWRKVRHGFATGESNPCECEQHAANMCKHWLLARSP